MGSTLITAVWLLSLRLVVASNNHDQGYKLETYEESPGIYFESIGQANLYSTEWKTIIYVPLKPTTDQIVAITKYVDRIAKLCSGFPPKNWTDCNNFGDTYPYRLRQLQNSEQLLFDLTVTGKDRVREKRGMLNFVGEVSKILFGTMDEEDTQYYNEQIKHVEENSEGLTHLLRQQLYVVKSSLGAVNDTLTDLEYNENKLREGLSQLEHFVDTVAEQTEKNVNFLSLKVTIESSS